LRETERAGSNKVNQTQSRPGLMPVDLALEKLLADAQVDRAIETIALTQALGRVLAQDVHSTVDVPPAPNSAMDGYCFRFQDYAADKPLPVIQRITAGAVSAPLQAGTAARIFTGAELPIYADTVVMQEETVVTENEDEGPLLQILEPPQKAQNVRPQGQDIALDQRVLKQGKRLRPQELGLLASIGVDSVKVYKKLRVAIMSTGDELIEPGQPLQAGQIYNSNRFTLIGLLENLGLEILDLGIVADDLQDTLRALKRATEADVIISSGGVSVGDADHVKSALQQSGDLAFWHLAIKPGKPFTYGRVAGTPFLGLPGNPAAVFVTFCLLCRPWLLKAQGADNYAPLSMSVPAAFSINKPGRRQEYLRARLVPGDNGVHAEIYPNQSSGVLSSASWGNGLVEIAINTTVGKGDMVRFIPYESFS